MLHNLCAGRTPALAYSVLASLSNQHDMIEVSFTAQGGEVLMFNIKLI